MGVDTAIAAANLDWFLRIARQYATDETGNLEESSSAKSLRSLQTLLAAGRGPEVDRWLETARARWGAENPLLPTTAELHRELIAELAEVRDAYPFVTTNLSLSHPAASELAVSLNVIVRLYDSAKRQRIKMKIGSFEDASRNLYWEVGFVDLGKSVHRGLRELFTNLQRDKGDYFLLGRLVDCTKNFILRRPQVAGLDLTPAFYHVASLCLRMGGVPVDANAFRAHLKSIQAAYERYLAANPDWVRDGNGRYRRWKISWLLERGYLLDDQRRALTWSPPRLLWAPSVAGVNQVPIFPDLEESRPSTV